MTKEELRAHPEYFKCMEKIRGYRPGFRFRMNWTEIPTAKANALKIVLEDATKAGYIESISLIFNWDSDLAETIYKRTDKEG